jgi:enterochelin esterase family protein
MFDGDLWADNDFGFRDAMAQRNKNATGPSPTVVLVSTPDRAILDKRAVLTQLLTEEILPALAQAGVEWSGIIVAGQSYGGLAAAGLLIDLPDLVDDAIVQSGSFWFDGTEPRDYGRPGTITQQLTDLAGTGTFTNRVVVQVGTMEGGMVDQSRWFTDAARDAGMDVHFDTYSGGHDYAWYRHGLLYAIDHLCP